MEEFGNALDFINHDVFYTRTPLDKRTKKLLSILSILFVNAHAESVERML